MDILASNGDLNASCLTALFVSEASAAQPEVRSIRSLVLLPQTRWGHLNLNIEVSINSVAETTPVGIARARFDHVTHSQHGIPFRGQLNRALKGSIADGLLEESLRGYHPRFRAAGRFEVDRAGHRDPISIRQESL